MNRRALALAAAGTLGFLLVSSPVSAAEASAQIEKVQVDDRTLNVAVSVADLATGESVNLDGVSMTVAGDELATSAEPVSDAADVEQVALLTLDTSGSMSGEPLAAAKQVANEFLTAVPEEVQVGLVTFATEAQLLVRPTTDRDAVSTAIASLQAKGKTSLYDAVAVSARTIAPADLGTTVILSDGADSASTLTLSQAASAAKKSGATFDAISFGSDRSQLKALEVISGATGGSVTSAQDAAQLSAAFDESAQSISNQYILTAELPDDFTDKSATITVSLPAGDITLTDEAFVTLAAAEVPVDPTTAEPVEVGEPGPLATWSGKLIWFAVVGIFAAFAILIYYAISSATDREAASQAGVRRRLSIYTLGGAQPVKEQETTVLGDTQVARSAVELAGRVVAQRSFETTVGSRLESAAVPLKPAEWLLVHLGVTLLAGAFLFFLSGGRLLMLVIGLVVGFIAPWSYLSFKERKRTKAFAAALPNTLQLLAGSLSAGYSMPQAVDTVVREASPPISTEFNRALVETRLGVALEDALDGVADRMKSIDFAWVVMAIRIQREVGGNLAEVLSTVADTLRERERLRRQVQVLSAEGRLSAWILLALPILFAFYLLLVRPEYLAPLTSSVLGWLMIGFGVFFMLIGGLWLRKIVKVEV